MPQVVVDDLAAHPATFPTDGLIFQPSTGKLFAELLRAAVNRAGLPGSITYHELRYYYASPLIRHGASIKSVQERLGQSGAVTTLNPYSHLVDDVLGASVHSLCTAPQIAR